MPASTQHILSVEVPVLIFEEDGQWIAYCPHLEVSSYGDNEEEARAAFEEALEIFFEETVSRGTLEKELVSLGWSLTSNDYRPPATPVAVPSAYKKDYQRIQIPVVGLNPGQRQYV